MSTLFPYTTLFRSAVHTSIAISIIGGLIVMVFGILFCEPLLIMMGTPKDILDLSILYMKIDRKSTRLNSSHVKISYAVFCLKKKTSSTLLRMIIILLISVSMWLFIFFFSHSTAPTYVYTLSLHDALPICCSHFYCY